MNDLQRAQRVDLELSADPVERRVGERIALEDAGVGNEDVDARVAEAFGERANGRFVGDVDAGFDLCAGRIERIARLAAHRDDAIAARGEVAREREADAAVRAGDEDGLRHGRASVSWGCRRRGVGTIRLQASRDDA